MHGKVAVCCELSKRKESLDLCAADLWGSAKPHPDADMGLDVSSCWIPYRQWNYRAVQQIHWGEKACTHLMKEKP